jgi:hypothetical protein
VHGCLRVQKNNYVKIGFFALKIAALKEKDTLQK